MTFVAHHISGQARGRGGGPVRAGLAALLVGILLSPFLGHAAPPSIIFAMIVVVYLSGVRSGAAETELQDVTADITVDESGLSVPTRRRNRIALPRRGITSAYVVDGALGGSPRLNITAKGGAYLTFEMESHAAAEELARDLGFGKGQRPITLPLAASRGEAFDLIPSIVCILAGYGSVLAGLAPTTVLGALLEVAMLSAAYVALGRVVHAPELVIGDDGIVVRNLSDARFTPGADLDVLTTASPIVNVSLPDPDALQVAVNLVNARFGKNEQGASSREPFARKGRTASEWRRELRVNAQESYRIAASTATPKDAGEVLDDPHATLEERAGAATALRVAGAPAERIRVAANAAVSHDLRATLEAIADADPENDAAFERALERMVAR